MSAVHTRQDLEQDNRDAERELQRYEEGILGVIAEHTADTVHFWEVRDCCR
jgi:hypothetical protein